MKVKYALGKALAMGVIAVQLSCATTKYTEGDKNVSHLQTGRSYLIKTTDHPKGERLIYTNVENGVLHGYSKKADTLRYAIPVKNITSIRDNRKANTWLAGGLIGAAGVSALVISATRAD